MALNQSATLMSVSARHTKRFLGAYREKGLAAVPNGHRVHRTPNANPEAVAYDVIHLAGTIYQGSNNIHLTELLSEREGVHIGRTTLRRILADAGMASPLVAGAGHTLGGHAFDPHFPRFNPWSAFLFAANRGPLGLYGSASPLQLLRCAAVVQH